MLKRLNYILLMTLFLAIQTIAQAQYVIDKVCKNAVRTYRVDQGIGEPVNSYSWILKDASGNVVSIPAGSLSGAGSEIKILWNFDPGIYTLSVEKRTLSNCTVDELGTIEVIPVPLVDAGSDQTVCVETGTLVSLGDAKVTDRTSAGIEWTTSGDGKFSDSKTDHPIYTPGPGDLLAEKVKLILTAKSLSDKDDGCVQKDEIEIMLIPKPILVITDPLAVCAPQSVDLTAASVIQGSTKPLGAVPSYWIDSAATIALSNPGSVTVSGIYYIKLGANVYCQDIKPVKVTVNQQPKLVIKDPPAVCVGETVDIGAAYITSGSDTGLSLSYWTDAAATTKLTNYTTISSGGIYYIKADNGTKCPSIMPVSVVINPKTASLFSLNNLLCQNSTPPGLPTTSDNNIKGTWSPDKISTSSIGTTPYVFTPNPGECGLPITLDVTITDEIKPVFAAIGPFCLGSVAPSLPLKSDNGITGKWSPTTISTTAIGPKDYIFTPTPGLCSNPVTISIAIIDPITPTFAAILPVCQNSAYSLPVKSIEGISGTWSPAFSSAAVGPKTYTFTPSVGVCAISTTMDITVVPSVTVTFDPIGPFCAGVSAPSLPTKSKEGISGTWSPATISTMSAGITNYIFTSVSGGVCSNPFSMPIQVFGINLAYTKVDLGYSTSPIGSIDLTVSGGSGFFSYSWDNGAATQDISGLAAGDYKVTVTDLVTLCTEIQTISITKLINDLVLVTEFTQALCPGSNDATATVTPSGGKAPYKYLWNNGQTDSIATGLIAGVYSVNVNDVNGLSRGAIITIPETAVKYVIASATPVDPACFGENGKIELTFGSGGIVPNDYYDILYDGGQFTSVEISGNRATISAPPGTYNNIRVFIRGCITNAVGPVTIAPAPPALTLPTIAIVQPDCDILAGTIEVKTPAPATGITYTLKGTNPVVLAKTNTNGLFTGLAAGIYDLTYTNAMGCTSVPVVSTTINAHPVTPPNPTAMPVLAECEKSPIQTLNANSGIVPPVAGITIVWYDALLGGNVVASPILNKPESITYFAEATNGKCLSKNRTPVTLTIIPTPAAPISKGDLTACESIPLVTLNANDAIDATGKKIVWYDKLVGGKVVTTPTLNAVKTVTYYAEDVNGVCSSSPRTPVALTIYTLPAKPTAIVSVVPRCIDTSGVIEVKSPLGANYVYGIDNEAYQSSATFTNQVPGDHSIRVKNTLTTCESGVTVIRVPDIPPVPHVMNLTTEDCICYGDSGKLNFEFQNVVDGTYVIIYVGGQFNNVKAVNGKASIFAAAGVYNVLAIEANGCTSSENWNVEIKQPDRISASAKITEIDLKSKQKGEINLTITGGTGPYQTIWQPNPFNGFAGAATEDIKNLDAGLYVASITDANGCPITFSETIPKANLPPIATNDEFEAGCGGVSGDLLYADNGSGIDSDPDVDLITIVTTPIRNPLHGVLTIHPDGTFEYIAVQGYTGDDTFLYTIFDVKKNYSIPAIVTIHVVSDFDCDGFADLVDDDADGDGILNVDEGDTVLDTDGDGHPNWLDIDGDDDGIVDNIEAQLFLTGYIPPSGKHTDNDGLDDIYDTDQNGANLKPVDSDGDGIPDFLDPDSDNDGVSDYIEGHDGDDADGKPAYLISGKDFDDDGLDDVYDTINRFASPYENMTGSNSPLQDFDGDGMNDWRDENDDDDEYLTRFEDLNMDSDFSNDDTDRDGHPEYLDYGRDCDMFIPNAFSPNDDNVHDYFQIYCIDHFPNARMYIFDQFGNKLYEQKNYGNIEAWGTPDRAWWDGRTTNKVVTTTSGGKVAPGTYYYVLQLGNGEVKKSFVFVSY